MTTGQNLSPDQTKSTWAILATENQTEQLYSTQILSRASTLLDRALGPTKRILTGPMYDTTYATQEKLSARLGRPSAENPHYISYPLNSQKTDTHRIITVLAGNESNRGRNPTVLIIQPKDPTQPSYELTLKHHGPSTNPYITEVTALTRDPQSGQYSGTKINQHGHLQHIVESPDKSISASYSANQPHRNTHKGRWSFDFANGITHEPTQMAINLSTGVIEPPGAILNFEDKAPDTMRFTNTDQDGKTDSLSITHSEITPIDDLENILAQIEALMPPPTAPSK